MAPTVVKLPISESEYDALLAWQGENDLWAQELGTGKKYRAQLFGYSMDATPAGAKKDTNLFVLMDEIYNGELILCTAQPEPQAQEKCPMYNPWMNTRGIHFDHQEKRRRVMISCDGTPYTRYYYSADMPKPYLYPLYGPKMKNLIQDGPGDHIHHHGIWWGHDEVNGHQVYHEFQGEGMQLHKEFLVLEGGPVVGQMTALIDWLSESDELLLQETRTIRFFNLPAEERYFDLCTQLHAVAGEVHFGTTKEGGFPFIRVNEQLCADQTGTLTASTGKVGEAQIYTTQADWVDYSGYIGKDKVSAGITVMMDPKSDDYPNQWFVRDYGPFTPSNFHFCGGYTLGAGETYSFRHRIYTHAGSCKEAGVAQRYQEYVN
ncbi:MAG: PmoA family protein [Firmicutes bacterium]|nr:PmoA family protein [Bacillota bacterium]